jgi:hypothetical protein
VVSLECECFMLVDTYLPNANFISARQVEVAAAPQRVWEVLPELPVVLRSSRWAMVATVPLLFASLLRGEHGRGDHEFGRKRWTFREGVVLAGAFTVDRVDPGREVVLVGRHRMAEFATNFYIEPMGSDRSRLKNVTRAKFRTTGPRAKRWYGVVGGIVNMRPSSARTICHSPSCTIQWCR